MANLTPEEILRGIIDGTIEELESDAITTLSDYKLYHCDNLANLSLPELVTTKTHTMEYTGITAADFPKCTLLDNCTFNYCSNLTRANVPKANVALYTQRHFANCPKLTGIVMPKATNAFSGWPFQNDTLLAYADLATAGFSQTQNFQNCTHLEILILRRTSSAATLANVNAFANTPFASNGNGGKLFVCQALISQYESATNWSTILGYTNNQILPIEGSEYEHYYADGTPIT